MGVAVFAPCLLVVVDGCFSPSDAARRLRQLTKCFPVEEKNNDEYKQIVGCVVHLVFAGPRKKIRKK